MTDKNLTEKEQATVERRDENVALGLSPVASASLALDEHEGKTTKKFVEYLSDGSLTVDKGYVVLTDAA